MCNTIYGALAYGLLRIKAQLLGIVIGAPVFFFLARLWHPQGTATGPRPIGQRVSYPAGRASQETGYTGHDAVLSRAYDTVHDRRRFFLSGKTASLLPSRDCSRGRCEYYRVPAKTSRSPDQVCAGDGRRSYGIICGAAGAQAGIGRRFSEAGASAQAGRNRCGITRVL